jgi:3-oxoacyl-[acyl-carrier protein] reductase
MMSFRGQVALVTGGGSGIGAATAERLALDGALVTLADQNELSASEVASSIAKRGGVARAYVADVSDPSSVEGLVDELVSAHGRLDILVTCAGILRNNLIHRMTLGDWDSVIDTHLKGTFLCAQAAQRPMVKQRFGKMVFISSIAALGNRGQANYSAAKAGIEGLGRTLAIELGPFGINVNAVAPGLVDTPMIHGAAERLGLTWDEFAADRAKTIPLGRICQPADIAAAITWLCSPDASMVSGQVLRVQGGP